MQEQKKMEKLYILCGLSNEAGSALRSALAEKAGELGYETVCVSRYRKEGIRQYISEHPEFRILILQEAMQSNYPYTAEELAELMDDYHLNIIISINKSHRANQYMKVLYTAGILNALYEEDATAENIFKRILYPRTRRECRTYYQITTAADAMSALDVVDEERVQGYLAYIEESKDEEEIRKKYRYAAEILKTIENIDLTRQFSERVRAALATDEIFQETVMLREKKKRWRFGIKSSFTAKEKKIKKAEKEVMPQIPAVRADEEQEPVHAQCHEAAEMIDEDISDLLGFGTGEKELGMPFGYEPVKKEEPEYQAEEEEKKGYGRKGSKKADIKAKARWSLMLKILLFAGAMFFLAATILFGFFLYSEQREKETSIPVISHITEGNAREGAWQDPETESRTEEEPHGRKEKKDEENRTETGTDAKKAEKPADTEEKGQRMQEAKEPTAVDMPAAAGQPAEVQAGQAAVQAAAPPEPSEPRQIPGEGTAGSVTVEAGRPTAAEEGKAEEQPDSYSGKIFTGEEIARIARLEEEKGNSLYLKTREAGEGIFSAEAIAGMVDGSCSYLAESGAEGQISFIQL